MSKFFPLLEGGVPRQKFFSPVWTRIKPNLVSKIFPFTRGGSLNKFFFPVWTCIKPNLVSKIFPFTGGGGPSTKIFFWPEHVSSQIWCQKIFPLLRLGTLPPRPETRYPPPPQTWDWVPPHLDLGPPRNVTEPGTPPKCDWTWDPPEMWLNLGPPPKCDWTWDPPPEMWTDWKYNLPPSFGWRAVINYSWLPYYVQSLIKNHFSRKSSGLHRVCVLTKDMAYFCMRL